MEREAERSTRYDRAFLVLSALVPLGLGLLRAPLPHASGHDGSVIRMLGLGWTGPWHAHDVLVGFLLAWLPGDRVALAGAMAAIAGAAASALTWMIAFRLSQAGLFSSGVRRSRLLAPLALSAALASSLGPSWFVESTQPGGHAWGACLALAAFSAALWNKSRAWTAALVGLAMGYDPAAGTQALVGIIVLRAPSSFRPTAYARPTRLGKDGGENQLITLARDVVIAVTCATLPVVVAWFLTRRSPAFAWHERWLEPGPWSRVTMLIRDDVGFIVFGCSLAFGLASLVLGKGRRLTLALLAMVAWGLVFARYQPIDGYRVPASALVALACAVAWLAPAVAEVFERIAASRLPAKEASAVLVLMCLLALPAKQSDDGWTRRSDLRAADSWNAVMLRSLAPSPVVLVWEESLGGRLLAAKAAGQAADVLMIPIYDLRSDVLRQQLSDPDLVGLVRDLALRASPSEFTLSTLAAKRAVYATPQTHWEKSTSRYLLPVGLLARFDTEPHGMLDRQHAWAKEAVARRDSLRALARSPDTRAKKIIRRLLSAWALNAAALGERELLSSALDEIRVFDPEDRLATTLLSRMLGTKGAIDVRDLALPE